MGTENRKTVAIALAAFLVAVLGLTAACTPEEQRETERELNEAEADLEAATAEAGEELEKMGAAMERGLERANERVAPYMADAELTAKVKAKLTADPEINPFQIDVDTVNGKVTLSGMVSTEREKEEAEHLARGTEGVLEVVNNLEVGRRGG
jgi:osmotically-inducible protein OsmY